METSNNKESKANNREMTSIEDSGAVSHTPVLMCSVIDCCATYNEQQPNNPPLYVTSCQHLLCHQCLSKEAARATCPVCNRQNFKTLLIGKQMPTEIRDILFKPLTVFMQEFLKRYSTVATFQTNRRVERINMLLKQNHQLVAQLKSSQEIIEKIKVFAKEQVKRKDAYKLELLKMREEMRRLKGEGERGDVNYDRVATIPATDSMTSNASTRPLSKSVGRISKVFAHSHAAAHYSSRQRPNPYLNSAVTWLNRGWGENRDGQHRARTEQPSAATGNQQLPSSSNANRSNNETPNSKDTSLNTFIQGFSAANSVIGNFGETPSLTTFKG